MRILIALPGLQRYNRGAEIAFIAVAKELVKAGDAVTLIGSGSARHDEPYKYLRANSVRREYFERLPSLPILRNEYCYEELTFAPELLARFRPADYDITVTCSYPFTNWILRRPVWRGRRPPHVFVTHNGDWPPYARQMKTTLAEFKYFGCEGLICINPDFFERNKNLWNCRLIPNGVDCNRFRPDQSHRSKFGLPENRLIVLMVSAVIPNKRIEVGIEAVSRLPGAHLVLAGDGPLRDQITAAAGRLLPGRFTRLNVPPDQMPLLYNSSDVFMQCSKDEPFPLVFLEAMACGISVVAHDMPRVRWFLGEKEFFADMDDPDQIAQAITRASASSTSDRDGRIKKASDLSWDRVAAMYMTIFPSSCRRLRARTCKTKDASVVV